MLSQGLSGDALASTESNVANENTMQKTARRIMCVEAEAIKSASALIDAEFERAIQIVLKCRGSVVVGGVGKSGLIGQKISATLASTGTPSHYVHATEAMHGDLGRLRPDDVALLLSNSGTTDEVLALASVLKRENLPLICITGKSQSPLSGLADASLCVGDTDEACPWNLAPTASTAAMLALGDAFALTLSEQKSFTSQDFHRHHPGGTLGKLLLPVEEILRFRVGQNTAVIPQEISLREMLAAADNYPRRCGAVLIVNEQNALSGIITDSDLRRLLIQHGPAILDATVESVMTGSPRTVQQTTLVREFLELIRTHRLDEVPVVNEAHCPIGILDVQDLVALTLHTD